jgi:metal-responsive CopG/Arc/MetJ family transcriptional regulator
MAAYHLMGILIQKRKDTAAQVQDVLSEHGCIIKVRLGLHEAGDACSEEGLVVLQLTGSRDEMDELYADLNVIDGVVAEHITLSN